MVPRLTVVTVTYSPGSHLDRFLSSLTVATDLPVNVVIADNGSVDGAPEEAVERYLNTRLLRTGSNVGTAAQSTVASPPCRRMKNRHRREPDVVVGPGKHR